jgi:sugar lactone lactonase YvrE
MNKKIKKSALLLLSGFLLSCSYASNPGKVNSANTGKQSEVADLYQENKQPDFIIDIGQNTRGATLSVNISNQEGFSVKANQSGKVQKTTGDIHHYLIYLIKDASNTGYPPGGDPLANIVSNGGPYTVNNFGTASRSINFINVGSSGSDYYFVAVRAQDAANNDLIEPGNKSGTNWAGTVQGIAVSTTGVKVDTANQALPTPNLTVNPQLYSNAGATLLGDITINPGNNTILDSAIQESLTLTPGSGAMINIAGSNSTGGFGGDGGLATSTNARLNGPNSVAVDSIGNIYIADTSNHRIRKVDKTTGNISTIAGSGTLCPNPTTACGDGGSATSTNARLNFPSAVAVDGSFNIYIADTTNQRIRKVTSGGTISTIAGTGSQGNATTTGTLTALTTVLNNPSGIAVNSTGSNIFFSNTGNHTVRMISGTSMTNFAGSGNQGTGVIVGSVTANGNNLNSPKGLSLDSSGNVYIANTGTNCIIKVTSGNMANFAGTGVSGDAPINGSQAATSTQLNSPSGVALDSSNNAYIANTGNHTIRKVSGGIMTTIAGTGVSGNASLSNGNAKNSPLKSPNGVAVDSSGNIFIANTSDQTIREVIK